MTPEMIEKFIENKKLKNEKIYIHLKQRNAIRGIFIYTNDYTELKLKNFWRIVPESKITEWQKTKDTNLARIFNGAEISRLSEKEV